MKPILLTLYFLVRLDGAILDVPLDRDEQGYYSVNATVRGNDTDVIRMRLQFASSTILSTRLMGSNVSIHTVVDDENIPLAEARTYIKVFRVLMDYWESDLKVGYWINTVMLICIDPRKILF
jgi:hypothetical protein